MFLRRKEGVTLIELLVVMTIVLFVMTAASRMLVALLTQFKQQAKITESSIESISALHILRRDLHGVGYGLAYEFENPAFAYSEAVDSPASKFNDGGSPGDAPRPIIANFPSSGGSSPGTSAATAVGPTVNDSDYLVIKSLTAAGNVAGGKYHFLDVNNRVTDWEPGTIDDLTTNDYVIVLRSDLDGSMRLIFSPSNNWKIAFTNTNTASFTPPSKFYTNLVYGVTTGVDLRFPFNRADYFITNGTSPYSSSTVVPERCAPGTGVLVKSVLRHEDGTLGTELPIMDCVADMQVVYRIIPNNDGIVNTTAPPEYFDGVSAEDLRSKLREVRVYILAHEGQYDPTYEYGDPAHPGSTTVSVGGTEGRDFDLDSWIPEVITPGTDDDEWKHYRWRVYTVVVSPEVLSDKL